MAINENKWTESICNSLKENLKKERLEVSVLQSVPYAIEAYSYIKDS